VVVGGGGRFAQFAVYLVQEILRFLSVTLHVPFIGLLGRDNFIEGLLTQSLGRRQVWVTVVGDVALGLLGHHGNSNKKQQTGCNREQSGFEHSCDSSRDLNCAQEGFF